MTQGQRHTRDPRHALEVYERREPTMGATRPAIPISSPQARPLPQPQRADRRKQGSAGGIIKFVVWVAVWLGMLCLSEVIAEASGYHDPVSLTVVLEVVGTVLMLLLTFWRTVIGLVWWFISLVIVVAVIKWAFLFVF